MSSLDGQDYSSLWNPLTLDGENVVASTTDINEAISVNNIFIEQNYLRLDSSNGPLTGTLNIQGNTSISGTSYFQNSIVVGTDVIATGSLDSAYVYGDQAEFGIDDSSMGVKIYNKLSLHHVLYGDIGLSIAGTITTGHISANTYYNVPSFTGDLNNRISVAGSGYFDGNISVSGLTKTFEISANTYYNLPPGFTGDLNGNLSVSGHSYFRGDISVSGTSILKTASINETYLPGYNYISNETAFLPNYPHRVGDSLGGGKLYSGSSLLTLDEVWSPGTITRISVNTFLTTISVGVSVSGTSTLSGVSVNIASLTSVASSQISVSGTVNCNTSVANNQYIVSNTTYTTSVQGNNDSILLFRNPSNNQIQTGGCRTSGALYLSTAWTSGVWLYNYIYRTSTKTAIIGTINATWYATSGGRKRFNVDFYSGTTYLGNKFFDKYFNETYTHEMISYTFTDQTGIFGNYTGNIDMYVYASGGSITSDLEDGLNWAFLSIG